MLLWLNDRQRVLDSMQQSVRAQKAQVAQIQALRQQLLNTRGAAQYLIRRKTAQPPLAGLVSAPWASASAGEAELRSGEELVLGEALVSADGSQTLVLQPDGVLALFGAEPEPRWVAGPAVAGSRLTVAEDGEVALTAADGTVGWRPDATGGAGSRLVLQDDGDLVVLDPEGAQVWDSGTAVRPSILAAGAELGPGDALSSPDGRHTLLMLGDGDGDGDGGLALLGPDATIRWSAGTDQPGATLTLREDGNLVVSDRDGDWQWRSRTAGHPGASLVLQDDGDLVLYDAAGAAVWRTGTAIGPAALPVGVPLAVGGHRCARFDPDPARGRQPRGDRPGRRPGVAQPDGRAPGRLARAAGRRRPGPVRRGRCGGVAHRDRDRAPGAAGRRAAGGRRAAELPGRAPAARARTRRPRPDV